ncbi:MAG: acyl-CoA carboxylase subunit beta, partial [Thermoanaerobaculia bacterium]|nr:acyl-CoA carboxylase subunit beta [Thermoanaerobaculia bacterium]
MPPLQSHIDVRSDQFRKNRDDVLEQLELIDELLGQVAEGGGEEAMQRLAKRDKLPVRQRVSLALDRDSPFLEISPLAAWESSFAVGSGFILGIGVISGVECVILG